MGSRHERRRDLRAFKREASNASLLTYLVEPGDGALNDVPLLKAAANSWLDALTVRARHCLICSCWVVNKQHVGALLLTTPDIAKPTSAGTAGICKACWDADLPVDALERAVEQVLQSVIPNGKLKPLARR